MGGVWEGSGALWTFGVGVGLLKDHFGLIKVRTLVFIPFTLLWPCVSVLVLLQRGSLELAACRA